MTKRWDPPSRKGEPFVSGERHYPALTAVQRNQLASIEPSSDNLVKYFPCQVRLRDSTWRDHVFVVESSEYIRAWGIWPDQDKGKREIKIEDVLEIQESSSRLPHHFAKVLYDAGESGMGYRLFALAYLDQTVSHHVAGGVVDFVVLPEGKAIKDIKAVIPHSGRGQKNAVGSPGYAWCLYSEPPAEH